MREAHVLARYLVGGRLSMDLARRYAAACRKLGLNRHDPVADAALRSPWMLGPLDAATALAQRDGVLRGKLIVMTAILETTTVYTKHFSNLRGGRLKMIAGALWHGSRAVLLLMVGLPILWTRGRR